MAEVVYLCVNTSNIFYIKIKELNLRDIIMCENNYYLTFVIKSSN